MTDANNNKSLRTSLMHVLWDGDYTPIDEHGISAPDELECGDAIENANDLRRSMMVASVKRFGREELLRDAYAERASNSATEIYGAVTAGEIPEPVVSQLVSYASDITCYIIDYAKFCAQGRCSDCSVRVRTVPYIGSQKFTISDNILDTFIYEEHVKELPNDISACAIVLDMVKRFMSDELGFFIQEYHESSRVYDANVPHEDQRAMRVSWFKPDLLSGRDKIRYMSQVHSWEQGVPIEDII